MSLDDSGERRASSGKRWFVITAAVYLGWHLIAGTGRETTLTT